MKMKVVDYLFFKLYLASKKSSLNEIPEWLASIILAMILGVNIIVISALLAKLEVFPFLFSSSFQVAVFMFIDIALILLFFLRKKRYERVIGRFIDESKNQQLRGNIFVIGYIVFTFLSIFLIAFFKPGKL